MQYIGLNFDTFKSPFMNSRGMVLVNRRSPRVSAKGQSPELEDFPVLQEFSDVFAEVPGLPPKRDIDFSIELIPRSAPVSRTPYRMSTLELNEL